MGMRALEEPREELLHLLLQSEELLLPPCRVLRPIGCGSSPSFFHPKALCPSGPHSVPTSCDRMRDR